MGWRYKASSILCSINEKSNGAWPPKQPKIQKLLRKQHKELVFIEAQNEASPVHLKEFFIFTQEFRQDNCRQVGSGHGNTHSAIPHFHRNTKSFLLYGLSLPPPANGGLRPGLSDRKFMLSYFFMVNGSITLMYLLFLFGVPLAVLMGVHISLDIIVTQSLSNAVSSSFKSSILKCNWRKKVYFYIHVWSKNIQHVSIDSTRHCILLTTQPITHHKYIELLTGNLWLKIQHRKH